MKKSRILRPRTKSQLKSTITTLVGDGYTLMPAYNKGASPKQTPWESLVSAVGYGGNTSGNQGPSTVASTAKENPTIKGKSTAGLGWMSWGEGNKFPNNIAALTGMLPYTATGWKFNTDVTAGLGPRPKYRYVSVTPGAGMATKEIDYDAAGHLLRQRLFDLRKQLLDIDAQYTIEETPDTSSDESSSASFLSPEPATSESQSVTSDPLGDLKKSLKEDIAQTQKEYDEWEKTEKEIKKFMETNNLNLLLLSMAADFHLLELGYPEIQLSSDLDKDTRMWKPRVTGIGYYSPFITRMERRDKAGRVNKVYLSNAWLEGKAAKPEEITTLPCLDPACPATDLERLLVDIRTAKNPLNANQRPTRFVLPVFYPTPGKAYYPQPSWHSIFGGSIYEYASTIISDRATRRKNSNIIGRIIYVHTEYMEKVFLERGADTAEKRAALFEQIVSDINEFLRDPDNSGQSLFAYTFTGADGKEHDSYRIVEIPASSKGTADANKTELEEVCNIIFFAMGLQPSLVGAAPGHSGSSGGTYQREMLLIKQLLLSPTQDLLLHPLRVASAINGWDSHLVWRIQQMALTTLDASKTGLAETETT